MRPTLTLYELNVKFDDKTDIPIEYSIRKLILIEDLNNGYVKVRDESTRELRQIPSNWAHNTEEEAIAEFDKFLAQTKADIEKEIERAQLGLRQLNEIIMNRQL